MLVYGRFNDPCDALEKQELKLFPVCEDHESLLFFSDSAWTAGRHIGQVVSNATATVKLPGGTLLES